MTFKWKIILVALSLLCSRAYSADYDVASVSYRGDCTTFGMRIERTDFNNGGFSIVTTGARFDYSPGELKIYQALSDKTGVKRLISVMSIEEPTKFAVAEANDDHVLLYSKDLNIGIYGDSTCILAPKKRLRVNFKGNFKPDYEGRFKGELLLIDDLGGMEIYPQRYESGYIVKRLALGKKDWQAEYVLNANERVMIAAFPGRHFDWEKSFKCNIVVTSGGHGPGHPRPKHPYGFGVLASDDIIRQWSRYFDILVLHWSGLWRASRPHGPYIPSNKPELRRVLDTAHKYNMKVVVHCSLFYFYRKHKDTESFYKQVKAVHDEMGTDGVYIDGLTFDTRMERNDNKIVNWEMVRRLRQLFGPDGIIIYHGTSKGSPVGTIPNIDSYCDATHYGEAVPFKSVDDPYVKYQIRKYGISNTVGLWMRHEGEQPGYITDEEVINSLLSMNCREWWNGYAFWRRVEPDSSYKYYMKRLAILERAYLAMTKPSPK